MAHFSKFIRPEAVRIGFENPDKELQVTAAKNPDGSVAVVVFNPSEQAKNIEISLENQKIPARISAKALQTVHLTF
jgi:glucosylceramidase